MQSTVFWGKAFCAPIAAGNQNPSSQDPGGEPCSGFVTLEVLRRKHLVLADIRCDNRFVLGQIE